MKKSLSAAPPRLQRMMLQLQKYDLDVIHVSGKDGPISDLLSRHPLPDTDCFKMEGLNLHVHTVLKACNVTDRRLDIIRKSYVDDSQMQNLIPTILEGWPSSRSECPKAILEYWNHRDELSFADDLIFRGQTILIPKSLRQEMIHAVHFSHIGVQKTLQRAKDVPFWPGMTKNLQSMC